MINDPDLFYFEIFIFKGMQKIAYEPRDYFQRITC